MACFFQLLPPFLLPFFLQGQRCRSVGKALGPAHCWHCFNSWVQRVIFLPSQLSVQTLLWYLYSPSMWSYTLTSAYIKIPSIGSCTALWTHKNSAHARSTLEEETWLPKWKGKWILSHTQFVSKTWWSTNIKKTFLSFFTFVWLHHQFLLYHGSVSTKVVAFRNKHSL